MGTCQPVPVPQAWQGSAGLSHRAGVRQRGLELPAQAHVPWGLALPCSQLAHVCVSMWMCPCPLLIVAEWVGQDLGPQVVLLMCPGGDVSTLPPGLLSWTFHTHHRTAPQ